MSEILTVTNLWHATCRVWTSSEVETRLCWMEVCDSVNPYTTILKKLQNRKQITDFATVSMIDRLLLLLLAFIYGKQKIRSLNAVDHSLKLSWSEIPIDWIKCFLLLVWVHYQVSHNEDTCKGTVKGRSQVLWYALLAQRAPSNTLSPFFNCTINLQM